MLGIRPPAADVSSAPQEARTSDRNLYIAVTSSKYMEKYTVRCIIADCPIKFAALAETPRKWGVCPNCAAEMGAPPPPPGRGRVVSAAGSENLR